MSRAASEIACDQAAQAIGKTIKFATAEIEKQLSEHNLGWAKDATEVVAMLAGALVELRGGEVVFRPTPNVTAPELKSSFSADE